ncbi:MAG: hypothetical protein HYR91_10540 [Flavobacteriia bacterium]|nr:hypothetical protein [Flavobacteriia bacterium]
MKTSVFYLFIFCFISLGISINSCNKNNNRNCKKFNVSASSKSSHYNSQSCIQCHTYGGKGEGCFNIAGSMYESKDGEKPLKQGYIKLYTLPNGEGEMKAKINVDASGNFYSSELGDVTHLYASITGPKGETMYMKAPLTSGDCNSCHGSITNSIWTK